MANTYPRKRESEEIIKRMLEKRKEIKATKRKEKIERFKKKIRATKEVAKEYVERRIKRIRIKKIAKAARKWSKKKTKFKLEEAYKPKLSKGEIKHFKVKRKLEGKLTPKSILEVHNVFFHNRRS